MRRQRNCEISVEFLQPGNGILICQGNVKIPEPDTGAPRTAHHAHVVKAS